jgi:Glycosyl transferase family 2
MATLFGHFWNESLLLPYWVKHHLPLFERAVLFDYASDDGSGDIVRRLAPHWEVRRSRNEWFDAGAVDREITDAERETPGWKICLNTTEFLLAPGLRHYCRWMERYRADVWGIWAFDYIMADPQPGETLWPAEPLPLQRRNGYPGGGLRSRILHRRPDGGYGLGRHDSSIVHKVLDHGIAILWFGWSPWPHVLTRKLQIQRRIPETDRGIGVGQQHFTTKLALEEQWQREAKRSVDLYAMFPDYRELLALMYPQLNDTIRS